MQRVTNPKRNRAVQLRPIKERVWQLRQFLDRGRRKDRTDHTKSPQNSAILRHPARKGDKDNWQYRNREANELGASLPKGASVAVSQIEAPESASNYLPDMTNAEFAKLLPKFGPQANAGDVVYILVADAHEHLGQSVAYARVNGIVPPWTVEAQKKAAAKKAEKK